MWLFKHVFVFILATATVNAESYYESNTTTWKDVTCTLKEPQLKFENGYFEVNETLSNSGDVWIGYIYAKVPFLLRGCASLQSEAGYYVKEIGDCFTICRYGTFGIKRTNIGSGLLCICNMASSDATGTSCNAGDQYSLCNNCSEIYTQINVTASIVGGAGNKSEEDCLTYYSPHFEWQPCTRTVNIRFMCSNATYTDLSATATIYDTYTGEWSAGNKLCLTNGRYPSFERSITNAGFGNPQQQLSWTGIFRAKILIQLSLKDRFSPLSNVNHVFVQRNNRTLYVAEENDTKRGLCITGSESTSRKPEIPQYTTEVTTTTTQATYSETTVSLTNVITTSITTILATDNVFPTTNDGRIEESGHSNSERSPAIGVGIGVSVGILFLVGGTIVTVVLKRRRVLPCWKIKTAEGQSRGRFEETLETNYEVMIERNESNESYCVLGRNVVSGAGTANYINPQHNQNDLNSIDDNYSPEYYNTGTYEYVQKSKTKSDLTNK